MSRIADWFNGLGRRRTPEDPDGRKHRLGFFAFVVAMLLLIGLLIAIRADRADAAVCYANTQATHKAAIGVPWVRLTASGACGTVRGPGARFTRAPTWIRTYGENVIWDFNKWFPSTTQSGVGTAPNGNRNVAYVARWVSAEFLGCAPPPYCGHSHPYGVRIWFWANGSMTGAQSSVVPFLPMPRP